MIRYIFWSTLKSYKYNFSRWLFVLIILLCSLILLNVTLVFVVSGKDMINSTFLNNNNLKWITADYDTTSMTLPIRQIERDKDERYIVFPTFIDTRTEMAMEFDEVHISDMGVALPYDALEYFGVFEITKEQWENEDIILLNPTVAEQYSITTLSNVKIPISKGRLLMDNDEFEDTELMDRLIEIRDKNQPIYPKIIELKNEIPFSDFKNKNIIPLEMVHRHRARANDIDIVEYKETVNANYGMSIIVREFEDIDIVAKELIERGFAVEYSLQDFNNLSKIIVIVNKAILFFLAFVSIIVILTIINCLSQFFSYKKYEIGLFQSIGINKSIVFISYFFEVMINGVLISLFMFPLVYFSYDGLSNFFLNELFSNNPSIIMQNNLYQGVFIINVIFIFIVLVLAIILPFYRNFKIKIIDLINEK